jgi:hypothetical protein
MEIQWFSKSNQGLATIYETNITLNTAASNHFKNAYTTLIGFEKKSKAIVIKAINKDEISLGLYNGMDTHPVSIKPSYGRINGKNIINNICSLYPLDFSDKAFHKFISEWDQEEKVLRIFLEREVS